MNSPVPTVGYILLMGASAFSLVYATSFSNGASTWSSASAERLQSERRVKAVAESVSKTKASEDKWLDAEKSKASLTRANVANVVIAKFASGSTSVSAVATEAPMPATKPGEAPSMPSAPAGAATLRFDSAKTK